MSEAPTRLRFLETSLKCCSIAFSLQWSGRLGGWRGGGVGEGVEGWGKECRVQMCPYYKFGH